MFIRVDPDSWCGFRGWRKRSVPCSWHMFHSTLLLVEANRAAITHSVYRSRYSVGSFCLSANYRKRDLLLLGSDQNWRHADVCRAPEEGRARWADVAASPPSEDFLFFFFLWLIWMTWFLFITTPPLLILQCSPHHPLLIPHTTTQLVHTPQVSSFGFGCIGQTKALDMWV